MRVPRYVGAFAVTALLLAGCGAGSSSKSSAGSAAVPRKEAGAPAIASGPASAGQDAAGQAGQGSAKSLTNVAVPDQAIAYTAELEVRAKNVTTAAAQAKSYVLAAGGYVASETGTTDPPSADLTLEVPAARYTLVLGQLTDR